jgi:hypothetical protein
MSRQDAFELTTDSKGDWFRNIVTLRRSVDVFSDLVEDPGELKFLIDLELATKPTRALPPIVERPFEEAQIYSPMAAAIAWPFDHPTQSRFSNGSFGVWYGARALATTIHETVYHFRQNTLSSEAVGSSPIIQERRVHLVHCSAMLVDLRARCEREPRLLDPDDYSYCQSLGGQLHAAAQPGILSRSARDPTGEVIGVFNDTALSNPRDVCYYTYSLDPQTGQVTVERTRGQVEMLLAP